MADCRLAYYAELPVYNYVVKFPANASEEERERFWGTPDRRIFINISWIDEKWRADITDQYHLPFFSLDDIPESIDAPG